MHGSANYDRLPDRYFDQDSIAGGIGDWDSESARARTRELIDNAVAEAIATRVDFGIESTDCESADRAIVERASQAGYRVEGVFIETESPEINAERVEHRVAAKTGHWVDVAKLPEQHRYSLASLQKTAEQFDELEVVDNSRHDDNRRPWPIDQLRLEKGVVISHAERLTSWCEDWLAHFDQRLGDWKR